MFTSEEAANRGQCRNESHQGDDAMSDEFSPTRELQALAEQLGAHDGEIDFSHLLFFSKNHVFYHWYVLLEDDPIHGEELFGNGQCRVKDFSNGNRLYC